MTTIGLSTHAYSGPPSDRPASPMGMACEAWKLGIKQETATTRWNDLRQKYGYTVRTRSLRSNGNKTKTKPSTNVISLEEMLAL